MTPGRRSGLSAAVHGQARGPQGHRLTVPTLPRSSPASSQWPRLQGHVLQGQLCSPHRPGARLEPSPQVPRLCVRLARRAGSRNSGPGHLCTCQPSRPRTSPRCGLTLHLPTGPHSRLRRSPADCDLAEECLHRQGVQVQATCPPQCAMPSGGPSLLPTQLTTAR